MFEIFISELLNSSKFSLLDIIITETNKIKTNNTGISIIGVMF